MIKISNLNAKYGYINALKGIDIEVKKGQIVTLLGANGAGKTTTLRCILGLLETYSGEILFKGENISGKKVEDIVKGGIMSSPEGRNVFETLSVKENLLAGAFTIKSKKQMLDNLRKVYEYFPILLERKNQMAGTLSGGEQQMLSIGRALMGSPEVLLLDEPSLGLAPLIVKDIFRIIQEISKEGTTVLLVEQNAMQALKISDYAYVLETGKIVHEGNAKELIEDDKIKNAYLGGN